MSLVVARLRSVQAEYGNPHVRMDPAKGEQMSQRLREDGLPVEEYVFHENSIDKLATNLSRLFAERRISVPDVPDLVDELANVILKTSPSGRTRIEHHSGRHDDQAVAIALAAHYLMGQAFYGAKTVTNIEALQRAPRIVRDIRVLPVGSPRGHVNRETTARQRLGQMMRRR